MDPIKPTPGQENTTEQEHNCRTVHTEAAPVTPREPRKPLSHILNMSGTPKQFTPEELRKKACPKTNGKAKGRTKEGFTSNTTAALKMEDKFKIFASEGDKKLQITKQVEDTAALTREHAGRRADLAFYTAVAYYKSGVKIAIGDTNLQFGTGQKKVNKVDSLWTEGAHSALVSSFVDSTYELHKKKRESMLSHTFFHKTLNSVVEVATVINDLDGELEGKLEKPSTYRSQYMQLLNRVSLAEITPVQFMEAFFKMMETFYDEVATAEFSNKDHKQSPKKSRELAIQYQREGTFQDRWFSFIDPTSRKKHSRLHDDYIHMLLKIHPKKVWACYDNKASLEALYEEAYLTIQSEIFSEDINKSRINAENTEKVTAEPVLPVNRALEF